MNGMKLLLMDCLIAFAPLSASALTYDIDLFRPSEIAKRGISVTIQETKSGALECQLSFKNGSIGTLPVVSLELTSTTEHASMDLELKGHEWKDALVCRFKFSRELLMHGHVSIGVEDTIPGGTFYHIYFADFVDFAQELPPSLKRRQARIAEFLLQNKLPRYEDSTPARGTSGDPKDLLETKTPIVPYKEQPQ
jgi:hypothetical protein